MDAWGISVVKESFAAAIMQRIATAKNTSTSNILHSAIELDSHADSPVVGRSAFVIEKLGRKVKVAGFSDALGEPLLVDVVNAAVVYDCVMTGRSYVMILRNALHIPSMEECLIHPIMMRLRGIEVDECPKFLSKTPSVCNHSIYFPDQDLRIPLMLDGIISCLPCRTPDREELMSLDILELTPDLPSWNPHTHLYKEQEDAMVDFRGQVKDTARRTFVISSVCSIIDEPQLLTSSIEENFGVSAIHTNDGSVSKIDPKELARLWNISHDLAKQTLRNTTQLCPRNVEDITLHRRYHTNDRMLRYRHLQIPLYSDTMFASKRIGKSIRNYTCTQVFASDFGWVRIQNLYFERDASKAFKALFKEVGVPNKLIMDGARSQVAGDTKRECDLAGCQIVELEKDTPWANRAERMIGLLKTECRDDMKKSGCPLVLWCYCLERRAAIISSKSNHNPLLGGMTPQSHLTGEPTDISHLCNFGWYEWIKYRKTGEETGFPSPNEKLGRCLGPANNQGHVMSQYVLTDSGEVIPIQTLRKLTQSERDSEHEGHQRNIYNERIRKRYGDHRSPPDNWVQRRRKPGDGEQYDEIKSNDDSENQKVEFHYQDLDGNDEHVLPEFDEVTDADLYTGAEVLLPHGIDLQAATVVGRT